jgi:6-phosphogluconolactonase (cycloisomerase 2 family)
MPDDAMGTDPAAVGGAPRGRMFSWVVRAARILPILSVLAIIVAIGGACGRSLFSSGSSSPTATNTPGVGSLVYVTNNADGTVSEFTRAQASGLLTPLATANSGAAGGPLGIAAAPSGQFLYAVNSADDVHEFSINQSTGELSSTASIAAGSAPQWIALNPKGTFAYVTNFNDGTVSQYLVKSGALTANGTATLRNSANPFGAIATSRFLYVADNRNGAMLSIAIDSNGKLGTLTSTTASANPGVVVIDPSGKFVYVSDLKLGLISFFTTAGGPLTFQTSYPTSASGTPAVGLAIAAPTNGNRFLYVANQSAGTLSLYTMSPSTGLLTQPILAASGLSSPTGLAADPSGSFLYVTNQTAASVTKYTIDATAGGLTNPISVATGNSPMYIAITQ